jgi:staphylococcal nuclease domain-containing protein 1
VKLIQTNEEIGFVAIAAGWVRIRPPKIEFHEGAAIQDYFRKLEEAEEKARAIGIGIWGGNGMRRKLGEAYDDQTVLGLRETLAIVEDVHTGSTWVLSLIPSHIVIDFQIAGVRSRWLKYGSVVDEVGNSAREWVVRNMLHRRIRVRISSKTGAKPFMGSILGHSDGAVQAMMGDGLLAFFEQTADFAPNADVYVGKQAQAIAKKVGIWGVEVAEQGEGRDFTGICVGIRGSSGIVLKSGNVRRTYRLGGLRVPYYRTPVECDPWGFEAREFLRKRCMGRILTARSMGVVAGAVPVREYAAIFDGDASIGEELLAAGLAGLVDCPLGTVPPDIAALQAAAKVAEEQKVGKWSDPGRAVPPIVDLSGGGEDADAAREFERIRNRRQEGVIEVSHSDGRFTVFLPEAGLLLRVAVNGLDALFKDSPVADQASAHCRDSYQQTTVALTPVAVAHHVFICDMFCRLPSGASIVVADDLVRRGFATVEGSVRMNGGALLSVESDARNRRSGIWAGTPRGSFGFVLGRPERVKVTQVWDTVTFTVQVMDRMQAIEQALNGRLDSLERVPEPKDHVAISAGQRRFRARVREVRDGSATVKLLDYGDVVEVPLDKAFELPPEISDIQPQAAKVALAFVRRIKGVVNSAQSVWEIIYEKCLYLFSVVGDRLPYVLLTDRPELDAGSLNLALVQLGLAEYFPCRAPRIFDAAQAQFPAPTLRRLKR